MSDQLHRILEMVSPDRKSVRISTTMLALLVAAGFFMVAIGNTLQDPLCCADDSYFSTAAKNFANGHGYAVSFQSPADGLKVFEPAITTGPTLILPAALLIKIFGNQFWITGVSTIVVNIFIFILLYLFSFRIFGLVKANIFSILLLFSFYLCTSPSWFILWYTILGEAAGAGFFLVGLLIFCFLRESKKYLYLSMFLFGLAIITKLIYLLILAPVLAYFYLETIHVDKFSRKSLRVFISGMLMCALPHIFWEIFKLVSLGISGYINLIRYTGNTYISIHGKTDSSGFWDTYHTRADILQENLGFDFNYILLTLPFLLFAIRKSDLKQEGKLFAYLSLGGIALSLVWWIFLSKGWIRYAMPWIFMFFTILPFLVLVINNYLLRICLLFLLFLNLNIVEKDLRPITEIVKFNFLYNTRANNLNDLVNFLKSRPKETLLVSSWWAAYADIEYALPGKEHFIRYDQIGKSVDYRKVWLVRNTRFADQVDFREFEKSFTDTVFYKMPYLVTKYSGAAPGEAARE